MEPLIRVVACPCRVAHSAVSQSRHGGDRSTRGGREMPGSVSESDQVRKASLESGLDLCGSPGRMGRRFTSRADLKRGVKKEAAKGASAFEGNLLTLGIRVQTR